MEASKYVVRRMQVQRLYTGVWVYLASGGRWCRDPSAAERLTRMEALRAAALNGGEVIEAGEEHGKD